MHPIQRREWIFPLFLALLICAAGTLPYLYARAVAEPGETFMGFVGRGTPGANSYFAFSRQAAEGRILVTNLYAPDAPSAAYLNPEWLAIGAFSSWTGLSLETIFHLERVLGTLAFLLAAYYFAATFADTPAMRRAALALIVFGAGFGWLIVLGKLATGATMTETPDTQGVSLLAYLVNKPHFIRAGACAALQYAWLARGLRTGAPRYFHLAGAASAVHGIIRPYQLPEFCLITGLIALLALPKELPEKRRAVAGCAAAVAWQLPVLAWYATVLLRGDLGLTGLHAWQPPTVGTQLVWFGAPFAACLAFAAWRTTQGALRGPVPVPALWLIVAMALVEFHPWFRWGAESYFAWALAPSVLFVRHVWPALADATTRIGLPRWALAGALAVAVLPGNLINTTRFFTELHAPREPWRYYLPDAVLASVGWLREHAPAESVVLASHDTSQFIPRLANLRVATGQDVLTPGYYDANRWIFRFFTASDDDGFKRWYCAKTGADFVIVGPFERVDSHFDPDAHPWLAPVFESGDVTVYRVALEHGTRG